MIDAYGYEIEVNGNEYTRQGVTIVADSEAQALNTFNSMLPDGYVLPVQEIIEPTRDEIIDQIKALMAQLGA